MKKLYTFLMILCFLGQTAQSQVAIKSIKHEGLKPTATVFSNDGKKIYVGSHEKHIIIYDIASSKATDTLRFHSGAITSLCISKNGVLASASWDHTIALWGSGDIKPSVILKGHSDKVNFISFSPDGKQLASVGDDGKLIIWDIITGGIIKEINAHNAPATSLCFRSDGKVIATASWDKSVKLWSISTGELMTELNAHKNAVNYVIFSQNDRFLVSCSDDNSMIVWETTTNTPFRKYEFYSQPVVQAIFLNNDNQLMSIDHSGEMKIYNCNNFQMLSIIKAHTRKAFGFSMHNQSGLLITFGEDNLIQVWDMGEYTYYECLKKKLPNLETLRKPKGEFETTDQYQKRISDYEKQKKSLVDECKKDAILEQQALEKMKLDKEALAYSWVNISLSGIGTYNADKAEYPVMIGNQTYFLKMNIEEGRTFKENWQKAKIKAVRKDLGSGVYLFFNMEMEHPVTKTKYVFGEQLSSNSDPAFKIFSEKQKK